jgi:hypothetical protein
MHYGAMTVPWSVAAVRSQHSITEPGMSCQLHRCPTHECSAAVPPHQHAQQPQCSSHEGRDHNTTSSSQVLSRSHVEPQNRHQWSLPFHYIVTRQLCTLVHNTDHNRHTTEAMQALQQQPCHDKLLVRLIMTDKTNSFTGPFSTHIRTTVDLSEMPD